MIWVRTITHTNAIPRGDGRMNVKDLTYEKGYLDGYKSATEHYQKIIQELVKMQPLPQYIVVTEEKFNELKEELAE